jgi:hypothetical protein
VSAIGASRAASPNPGSDPLAAIDLNRNAIIADIVRGFEARAGVEGTPALKARLEKLRADRLLAASLASSRESLDAIIAEAESPKLPAFTSLRAKSLGDPNKDLLYTPLTPCRLIDTRGNGAPFQGGAFAPGERRAYVPAGACAIPATGVATLLISFTTQNLTPVSGGVLAILAPAAPFTATVDVFNLGSTWSASNTAVATGGAGQFDVYVLIANAHVVVDVLGYFAPLQGNITLAQSTATAGNIMKGANRFIHNSGIANTFIGDLSGNFAMSGSFNTAVGSATLGGNTTGNDNTAIGSGALGGNSTGNNNTASGAGALNGNTTGTDNTASGVNALTNNTAGSGNTASGAFALSSNTTGGNNIAVGSNAGSNLTTGSNNIHIGNAGFAAETGTIRIGGASQSRTFISAIRGVTTGFANAAIVFIDSDGQLGTVSSSRRFKDDVADMDAASSALMKLRPVTFHYKADKNPSGRAVQYGLIAEEVADVYPGLVARSADGHIETVMYQFLPSMLLNEYQKQQRAIHAQSELLARQTTRIAELERDRGAQLARIDALERQAEDIVALKQQAARMVAALERLAPVNVAGH